MKESEKEKAATGQNEPSSKLSRRDFISRGAATGLALGAGQLATSALQAAEPAAQAVALKPENSLPKGQPEIYKGTSAGAVLAQLRAAGLHMLFHTNTSGFVPFF